MGGPLSRERVATGEKLIAMIADRLLRLLPLNRAVIERASAMQLACHPTTPLQALDALYVATCEFDRSGTLSTTDNRMRAACERFAIALVPAGPENATTN
jgi:predicted nucleic acid-binding protein